MPDNDHVAATVAGLAVVPDSVRRHTVPYDEARRHHRLPRHVLDAMVSQGFGRRGGGEVVRFDRFDLVNVALALGVNCVWTFALMVWGRMLAETARGRVVRTSVGLAPRCSGPPHVGACQFSLQLPDRRLDYPPGTEGVLATLEFVSRHEWPTLPHEVRQLVRDFEHLEFRRLPPHVAFDVDFTSQTNVTDCGGAAALIAAEGRRRGIPIRHARGLLLSAPYSGTHDWLEVLVDDVWVAIDPVFLRAMVRWGIVSGDSWDQFNSPGALLARFTGVTDAPLALDHGRYAALRAPTRQVFVDDADIVATDPDPGGTSGQERDVSPRSGGHFRHST